MVQPDTTDAVTLGQRPADARDANVRAGYYDGSGSEATSLEEANELAVCAADSMQDLQDVRQSKGDPVSYAGVCVQTQQNSNDKEPSSPVLGEVIRSPRRPLFAFQPSCGVTKCWDKMVSTAAHPRRTPAHRN